jgi:hypothetical protein
VPIGRRRQQVPHISKPLICVEDPRKGGVIGHFFVVLRRSRPRLGRVDRQSGSRWSARSAARTNDLDTDEDPPHTRQAREQAKTLVVQVIWCLP